MLKKKDAGRVAAGSLEGAGIATGGEPARLPK